NKQSGSLITRLGSRDARLDVESDLTAVRGRADEASHAYAKLSADRQAFIETSASSGTLMGTSVTTGSASRTTETTERCAR
ncbi:hypothetical protein ACC693_38795, partial [Rhizobium ruizarguesonis]